MKHPLLIFCCSFVFSISGQTNWQWALAPDSSKQVTNRIWGMALDQNDDVFLTAEYKGSLSLASFSAPPTTGTNQVLPIIAKINSNGNLNWLKYCSSSQGVHVSDVCTDDLGNCYALGTFQGSMSASGSQLSLPSNSYGIFLLKYAPNGTLLWSKTIGQGAPWMRSIRCSGNNLYIVGSTSSNAYNPVLSLGSYSFNFSNTIDVLYGKLDTAGTVLFADRYKGFNDYSTGMAISPNGNITLSCAALTNSLMIGTYTLPAMPVTGVAFSKVLINLSPSGTVNWVRRIENVLGEMNQELCSDINNNLYLAARMTRSLAIVDTVTIQNNSFNGLLIKFDQAGNMLWNKTFRGSKVGVLSYKAICYSVYTDENGNVTVSGTTGGPYVVVSSTDSIGNPTFSDINNNIFVAQFSANGTLAGMLFAGGPNAGSDAYQVLIDQNHNIVLGGTFFGKELKFGPHTLNGIYDSQLQRFFVAKAGGIITGIPSTTSSTPLTIFPIPTTSGVIFTSENNRIQEITLFDLSGKQVAHKTCTESKEEFSLVGLATGIYMARVETQDHQIKTLKVVKVE